MVRMQKPFVFIFFLSAMAFLVHAQSPCTLSIRGRVVDSDTKLPLAGVTINFSPDGQGRQVISDGHGYFQLSRLCASIRYTVTASSVGFDSLSVEFSPVKDRFLTIALHHGHILLHDVDVVGHQHAPITSNAIRTVSREQAEQSRGKTLAEIFGTLPGVSLLQTGTTIAKPVINGLHSNRILILNNGLRQEGQQWGSEHAPEIDPFIAKDFKLIKGAEGVRYGADAIGGVMLVTPPPLPIDAHLTGELHTGYQANGHAGTVSGMLQSGVQAIPGLAWRLQGTVKRAGNVRTATYNLGNTGLAEHNLSAALRYQHTNSTIEGYYSRFQTAIGIFTGAHIGTLDDIQARIDAGKPTENYPFTYTIDAPRQSSVHQLGKVKWHRDYAQGATLDVQYGIQRNHRQEYDVRRGGRDALPMLDMVLTTQTVDADYQTASYGDWKTQVGTNVTIQVNNNVPGTLNTPLIPNFDSQTVGAFVIQRLVRQTHEWEMGIRYDYRSFDAAGFDRHQNPYGGTRDFHNVSGSAGGVWRAHDQWQLRSNVGLAWRAPTANELYSNGLHHGAAVYEIGDDQLGSEQGYKWVVSPSYADGSLTVDLDIYAQFIQDYIYAMPSPGEFLQTIRGTFPVFRYQQNDALFFGGDLSLQYDLFADLSYQLNASVVRARDVDNAVYLPYIPSDRLDNRLRKAFSFHASTFQDAYLTVTHRWVRRQDRYEPGTDYAVPPPAYHLFALHGGSQFTINGHHRVDLGISVNNLFNTAYKEYMNRFRYYAHNLGREIGIRLSYTFL